MTWKGGGQALDKRQVPKRLVQLKKNPKNYNETVNALCTHFGQQSKAESRNYFRVSSAMIGSLGCHTLPQEAWW